MSYLVLDGLGRAADLEQIDALRFLDVRSRFQEVGVSLTVALRQAHALGLRFLHAAWAAATCGFCAMADAFPSSAGVRPWIWL